MRALAHAGKGPGELKVPSGSEVVATPGLSSSTTCPVLPATVTRLGELSRVAVLPSVSTTVVSVVPRMPMVTVGVLIL